MDNGVCNIYCCGLDTEMQLFQLIPQYAEVVFNLV